MTSQATPSSTKARAGRVLTVWTPEDKQFWEQQGRAIANINLAISIPALLLSFAVWMVWSVVVVNLPNIGFKFTTNQLFWLAALPALCGDGPGSPSVVLARQIFKGAPDRVVIAPGTGLNARTRRTSVAAGTFQSIIASSLVSLAA